MKGKDGTGSDVAENDFQTLREALRRLSEWNLVAARRGSGVAVREMREWMIEVLPSYLRHSRPGGAQTILELVREGLIEIVQSEPYAPLHVRPGKPALRVVGDAVGAAADRGRPRLWIDRSFTIRGAGTVVTGTLGGGRLAVGDELAVLPGEARGRAAQPGGTAAASAGRRGDRLRAPGLRAAGRARRPRLGELRGAGRR